MDADLPMILVTGHGDIAMAVKALQQGAYDFIEKPASSDRIVAVVQRAVEKRRLVLALRAADGRAAAQRGIEAVMAGPGGVRVCRALSTGGGREGLPAAAAADSHSASMRSVSPTPPCAATMSPIAPRISVVMTARATRKTNFSQIS